MALMWVEPHDSLPTPNQFESFAPDPDVPDGLIAAGRDLNAARLYEAYKQGIFPWFSDGQPVLWWSPNPRMVLFPSEFKIRRSLRQKLRRSHRLNNLRITVNQAFDQVIAACAAPRGDEDGTWITPEMVLAYRDMHTLGYAHSIELWRQDLDQPQRLVGGLYGIAIGRIFYGESMFAHEPDASKIALAALVNKLETLQFRVIDCQQNTAHLASLGAREISRNAFLRLVRESVQLEPPDWSSMGMEIPQA